MKKARIGRILLILLGLFLLFSGFFVITNAQAESTYDVGFYITDENHSPTEHSLVKVKGANLEEVKETQ